MRMKRKSVLDVIFNVWVHSGKSLVLQLLLQEFIDFKVRGKY